MFFRSLFARQSGLKQSQSAALSARKWVVELERFNMFSIRLEAIASRLEVLSYEVGGHRS